MNRILRQPLNLLFVVKNKVIKRRFLACGDNLLVHGYPRISYPSRIELGNNVSLNHACELNATSSHITIGNNCTISAGAKILAASYNVEDFIFRHIRQHESKPVIIGDDVWICAGAIICLGIKILGGAIIAAGSVVTKDITEKNVLVAGNPARIVKRYNSL